MVSKAEKQVVKAIVLALENRLDKLEFNSIHEDGFEDEELGLEVCWDRRIKIRTNPGYGWTTKTVGKMPRRDFWRILRKLRERAEIQRYKNVLDALERVSVS